MINSIKSAQLGWQAVQKPDSTKGVCDRRQPAWIFDANIVIAGLDPAIHLLEGVLF